MWKNSFHHRQAPEISLHHRGGTGKRARAARERRPHARPRTHDRFTRRPPDHGKRERLTFTARLPDHGKRERFTTRSTDHGKRERFTFSAGPPDHGKRARFTIGPPDKRSNLGGTRWHQLLFLTPLSVFSLGRFWARWGCVLGLFCGLFSALCFSCFQLKPRKTRVFALPGARKNVKKARQNPRKIRGSR